MDNKKFLQEKQMSNLLKAVELKNSGIEDKALLGIVDYVIEYEVKELSLKPVVEERPTRRSKV
jgi:hypothetical protein